MKRFMFVIALLLLVGLSSALAQTEAVATALAAIEAEFLIEGLEADWGLFAPGVVYTISASGFKAPPGPEEGVGVGVLDPLGFEVSGSPGTELLVYLVLPAGMSEEDGNAVLPMSNWTYGWNYDADPEASFVGAGPLVGNAVQMAINSNGTSGLYLGATVTVPVTAFIGSYFAEIIGSAVVTGN